MYDCADCILAKKCPDNIVDGTPMAICPDKLSTKDIIQMPADPAIAQAIQVLLAQYRPGVSVPEEE